MIHLILFVSLFLFPRFLPAADRVQEEPMPPVVVTATRLKDVKEEASKVPGKVIVVTAEDIQKLGAKTIQEVLQYQTGIVLYDQIGNEFQSSIDLRGFNGQPVPATSVFVDGVRINEPDFNSTNFDLVPLEAIDRIEIMPGTATVFGRNALAGVINITTKRGRTDQPHLGVDLGGGSFGRQKHSFATDGPLPIRNLDYAFGVTRELTDGFRDATGGRITRIFGKLGYTLGASTDATLSYTHVQDRLKQAGSLPASILHFDRRHNLTPGDFSDSQLDLVALNVRLKLPAGFSLAANGFIRNNDQTLFIRGLSSVSTLDTGTLSAGTTIQATHEGDFWRQKNLLSLGIEYSRNRFDIVNSGVFLPAFSFLTRQATKEDVVGVYVTDSFELFDGLILNGGLRYDWDRFDFTDKLDPMLSGTKTYRRASPKAGVVYTPFKDIHLSFSYSEGVRIPTVNEIFAQGPFGSNSRLDTMKSRNFELGARAKVTSWLDASLALFYMPVRDEILFVVTDPVNFFGRNENISRTLRRGVEATVTGRYGKLLDAFLNYTLTKATFETDVLLFSGQVQKRDELPLVPRHRVGVGINLYPLEGLTVSLFGDYVSKQFLLRDEPNEAKKLADYFVLNGRLAYSRANWTAHVTVNNLTDLKYSTFGVLVTEPFYIPAPGINVFAGVTFRY
jgi:outer membrane receptor protein involved in Fe transport